MLNLDTHILLHALSGRLHEHEITALQADGDWSISAIVLWEIEKLHQRGRIPQGLGNSPLKSAIDRLHIWPITPDVCLNIQKLDFQSDPADELIAATSLTHNIPLVTRDSRIRTSAVISCI